MRLADLPHGAVRLSGSAEPLYLPRTAGAGSGRRLKIGRRIVLGLAFLGLLTVAVGDGGVLATVKDERPSWATALRAPDPGVALSPHFAPLQDGLTPTLATAQNEANLAQKGDRLMTPVAMTEPGQRASVTHLPGLLSPVETTELPRVSFVMPRTVAASDGVPGAPPARPAPSALAEAAMSSMLTAYASDRVEIEEPFQMLLGEDVRGGLAEDRPYGVSGKGRDHWWSDRPLPEDLASAESVKCLAQAVYFEARGESVRGQEAVAQVVINRVKNPAYPDDVCSVVFQNRKWYNRCQFTFACDRIPDVVRDPEAWEIAMTIATNYAEKKIWIDDVGASTHYHTVNVSPKWAPLMRRVKTIGDHIFYITRNGGWT
ncbi:cell wall hydrolase [Acuticoccus sp. M5D2P5]|uniref:cell wall hydrolase n=1 Tax=Acuticoccus kalidii TaxID=2910977 RepID=UPI001F40FD35|nr:cell wall hydrolase [Acuticoccus kalidii]MCF3936091.1 cell wall hydrolase [Acuticoccus kalidii]